MKKIHVLTITIIAANFCFAQADVSCGSVQRFNVSSQYVDSRNVDVWLPDGFDASDKYAVLYMHDGQNLFDSLGVWNRKEWMADEVLCKLMGEKKVKNVIVVGIWNNGMKRHTEYFPQKAIEYLPQPQKDSLLVLFPERTPLADNYLKFIVTELKPFIDSIFPTYTTPDRTFISGSSMGGLISMYAVCEYPDVFSGAACLSTHWIGTFVNNKEIPEAFNTYMEKYLPSAETHLFYFDHGTVGLDANYPPYQKMIDETARRKGYDQRSWKSIEFTGHNHSEIDWAKRLDIPLLFLLGAEHEEK
jgi:predicted alpha/beta superfamily hydrolase